MSRIATLRASALDIPFKVAFRHASADRSAMQSLWVQVELESGATGLGEGCPRDYVTGESLESALAFVERHTPEWRAAISDAGSLARWVEANRDLIDANAAAWCAVELALLDALGREAGMTVERVLGLEEPRGPFRYSAVLGDASPPAFAAQLSAYRKAGLGDFKIKLSGDLERDRSKIAALRASGIAPAQVRADANNLWREAPMAIAHLGALDFRFHAIEEPLAPGDHEGLRRVAAATGARIVLDESALREGQLDALEQDAARWLVNVRVSKMGGLLRGIRLVGRARQMGLGIIVGAHVGETSVLTRAALVLAQAAGSGLVAQEGAFGTFLLEHDPVVPCWMFGQGGVLDPAAYAPLGAGFGLAPA